MCRWKLGGTLVFVGEMRCFFGVLKWKLGGFLVFSGGLGEVGGGARIIDIPKENLGFGAGTASFPVPHSLF